MCLDLIKAGKLIDVPNNVFVRILVEGKGFSKSP